MEKRKFTMKYHNGKLNVLPSNYKFLPMTFSQVTVNWWLGSVYNNVPPFCNIMSDEVKHKKNGTRCGTWWNDPCAKLRE